MSRLVTGVQDAQQGGRPSNSYPWGLAREFAASGISVGCANTFLNPVEVIKTRMQLNGAAAVASSAAGSAAQAHQHAACAITAAARAAAAAAAASPAYTAAAASAAAGGAPAAQSPALLQAQAAGSSRAAAAAAAARFFSSHHTSLPQQQGARLTALRGTAAAAAASSAVPSAAAGALMLPVLAPHAAAASSAAAAAAPQLQLVASLDAAAAAAAAARRPARRPAAVPAAAVPAAAAATAALPRPGFAATAAAIMREEGPSGFTRGIQASATRAVLNGGIRLGLYDPIKTLMSRDGSGADLHVGQKLAAGSISGCVGAVLTTPIELAKTRLQAPCATTRSMSGVLRAVVAQQGVTGLWRGATPSVLRLIMLNGSMVATYDEVKGHIRALTGFSGLRLVLASSMVAGLVTTTVINPADVCRAYMQTGRGASLAAVARSILAREGPAGFLKGWTAAYARTGPQTLIIFTVSELVRPLFGLNVIGGSG